MSLRSEEPPEIEETLRIRPNTWEKPRQNYCIHEIASSLHEDDERYDARHPDRPRMARTNQMSQIGHPCTRYLALDRLAGDLKTPFAHHTLRIFARGRSVERWAKEFLFERWHERVVQLEQNVEIPKAGLAGRIDVGWRVDSGRASPIIPLEIKSTAQFGKLRTREDLLGNRWTNKWVWQLNGYIYAMKQIGGLFLLVDPVNFATRFVGIDLDWEMAEESMRRGEEIEKTIISIRDATGGEMTLDDEIKSLLPPEVDDVAICSDCRLRHVCNPSLVHEASLVMLTDSELEESISRMLELKPLRSEHDDINEDKVKPSLRFLFEQNPGAAALRIGKFLVKRKAIMAKAYSVKEKTYDRFDIAEIGT